VKFTIAVAGRGQNPHADCFNEVTKALAEALKQLGHEVTGLDNPGRPIVFNVEKWGGITLPPDAIVFNAEQVGSRSGIAEAMPNFHKIRNHVIWDYAQRNVEVLRSAGAERVIHCPIGYMPSMSYIEPAPEQDIDVLFYGSMNAKRRAILTALKNAGLNVIYLFGAYDVERDAAIARAKVVLNLHYFEDAIFEIFRVSHLLANKVCVVTEDGGCDPELEMFATLATRYCTRDGIVAMCKQLVADTSTRQLCANVGYEEFRRLDFVEHVRRAIEQS
jgi:hypothetical protein